MRTGLRIDAFVRQPQPLHRTSTHKVLFDNGRSVPRLHVSVPDRLGVDHYGWPMFALIQAEGFVDANSGFQPGSFGQLL